jgi:hypothetical protein
MLALALMAALQEPPQVYFGNLPSQTSYSDGSPAHQAVDQITYNGAPVGQVIAHP